MLEDLKPLIEVRIQEYSGSALCTLRELEGDPSEVWVLGGQYRVEVK